MDTSSQLDAMALWKRMRAPAADVTLLKPEPVTDYSAYNNASAELEFRIEAVRQLPEPPTSLLEGLLLLGVPDTIKQRSN